MANIRILVLARNMPPTVHTLPNASWRTWYKLVDPSTSLFQVITFKEDEFGELDLLCDQEGRQKGWEPNVYLPAEAPKLDTAAFDFIIWQRKFDNGRRLMQPNEPGIGFHEIVGTCIIARRRDDTYVDLTDNDIADVQKFYAAHHA